MDTLLLSWPSLLPPVGSVCRSASSCLYSNKLQFGSPWRTTKPRSVDTISKLTVRCGGGSSIRAINESEFQSAVLESDRPVLVEFVATWCGPCRLISPAMESISQEYGDKLTIIKVDHDANPRLIQEYKVYGLPTLILFNNGHQVLESRREGAITKVKLKQYLDTLLEMISVL